DAIPREQIRVLDANGDGKDDLFVALTLDYGEVYVSDDPDEAVVSKTIPGPDAITVDIDGERNTTKVVCTSPRCMGGYFAFALGGAACDGNSCVSNHRWFVAFS
ncbi:MAG TPA: hypothetical protein PK156_48870, partial [Polyangium sp.]|nr:hypothetical protein [Polyangium sp.]